MKKINRIVLSFVILLFLEAYAGLAQDVIVRSSIKKISAFQGEKVILDLEVKNKLPFSIRSSENYFFSYHIYDIQGRLISFDNRRFKLPKVLRRKRSTRFKLPIYFEYEKKGIYKIKIDIVKEGKFWGSQKGWDVPEILLNLKELFSENFKKKYLKIYYQTDNDLINKEQYILRITLKNSEIKKNEKIFGFSPGSDYSQVWIRDIATFIYYSKHFYHISLLQNILELFLVHQKPNGEIYDWVSVENKTDKNTVSTDQESSLIIAAYTIAAEDPAWLKKKIKKKTVFKRLDNALEWVWNNKRNKKFNLIVSGFNADWGDVEKSYPDQRATKLSDRSIPVLSIYTQSKYIQAIQKIVFMAHYFKNSKIEKKWKRRLLVLKAQTKRVLYLKDKGYFITHIVPSTDKYFSVEREILPVGGNAEAMIAGLMTKNEIKRFLCILKERRKKYGLRTVSFTLIPPYKEGFFPHPALYRQWCYQNGGEWDWIGGRLVKALFITGFRKEAISYVEEIIRKNLKNYNIFEWEDRNGIGRGALFYVGAAGVIGDAIFKGYVGLKEKKIWLY